jgi:hypothetical protein
MSAVIEPVNRNLPPAERIAAVQDRINRNLYGESVMLTTADKMLPVLMADSSYTVDVSGYMDESELCDRYDGRDYNDQEQWR